MLSLFLPSRSPESVLAVAATDERVPTVALRATPVVASLTILNLNVATNALKVSQEVTIIALRAVPVCVAL